jgi:hypothetical protein
MMRAARSLSRHLGCCIALASALWLSPALAGRSCEEQPPAAEATVKALQLATAVQRKLEESGAQVALIGRSGQNLEKYGVRYSHFGFVWRDHPKGRWSVIHQLNHCGTADSAIYDQGLGNFFLDDLWRMEAVVLVPNPETQSRLAALLAKGDHLHLHTSRYNMLAYAFSTRYQNSNQWALEVLAKAESRDATISTRGEAQQWLRLVGYAPQEIRLDALTRLGARVTRANVSFDDHPSDLRWSDRIRTVTVDSVFAFVRKRDAEAREFSITSADVVAEVTAR